MRLRFLTVIVVLAVAHRASFAQQHLTYGHPHCVGMSSELLQDGVQLFREAVEKDELRGAALLVARDGQIVLHDAVGWRNKERDLSMQSDTLFRMASNTKAVVATGVLLLAEDGELAIDDPIGKHLPAFDNDKCRLIKVRHLLSHTSGLRISTLFLNPLMKPSDEFPHAPSLQLEVNRFAAIGPAVDPGTTFSYNNPGYNTLGALIEAVSGQPLERFLTNRIYRPLGMCDTSNHPPADKLDRMSVVYARKDGKWSVRFGQQASMRVPFVRASGGMVSTAGDFAKFCQMHLNGGTFACGRLLTQESVAEATSPQTQTLYSDEELKSRTRFYGFGWSVESDGVHSHGGSEGTHAWVDPSRRLICLVFTQSPGGKNPRNEFWKLVTAACED